MGHCFALEKTLKKSKEPLLSLLSPKLTDVKKEVIFRKLFIECHQVDGENLNVATWISFHTKENCTMP